MDTGIFQFFIQENLYKEFEKYYQIAQSLEANLYKNKTLIDEKQLNKIREKYKSKGGKQAPKEE
jgi:hypothetical protein